MTHDRIVYELLTTHDHDHGEVFETFDEVARYAKAELERGQTVIIMRVVLTAREWERFHVREQIAQARQRLNG